MALAAWITGGRSGGRGVDSGAGPGSLRGGGTVGAGVDTGGAGGAGWGATLTGGVGRCALGAESDRTPNPSPTALTAAVSQTTCIRLRRRVRRAASGRLRGEG